MTDATDETLTVSWTQVRDSAGGSSRYRVEYTPEPFDWAVAPAGCAETVAGTGIGTEATCTVEGLEAATRYAVRVASFRDEASSDDQPVDTLYSNVESARTHVRPTVRDLQVASATASDLALTWTQIHDGRGEPASYRVKYSESPLVDWKNATIGCDRCLVGDQVGAPMSCTVEGLEPGTTYDVQLMSYRMVDDVWAGAEYSNVATATTGVERQPIWVDPSPIDSAPRSGAVWEALLGSAEIDCGTVDISDPERYTHLCVMTRPSSTRRPGTRLV